MLSHRFLSSITTLLLTLLLVGCAARVPVREELFRVLPDKYRLLATERESRGEPHKALLAWQVVAALEPNDAQASERILALQEEIRQESDKHFRAGLDHFQKNSFEPARKEFLIALAYNPDHAQALHYLKHELIEPDYARFQAKEGDTPRSIAEKVYRDPDKDFVVAYFNDLDIRSRVQPGTNLKLPIHEARPAEDKEKREKARALPQPKDYPEARPKSRPSKDKEKLRQAQALFNAKEYQQALLTVEKIVAYAPSNREAVDLRNASCYELGVLYLRQSDWLKSLEMFKKADLAYRDVGQRIAYLEKQIKEQAEIHYNKGMAYFLAEDLDRSAEEWEKTLQLDPEHAQAKRDLEKTRRLLKKLGRIR